MRSTWVLIAHLGGARILENKGPGKGLILLQDIPHPEGKLKSRDLGSDEPGRSFDSHGARHSIKQEVAPPRTSPRCSPGRSPGSSRRAVSDSAPADGCSWPKRVSSVSCAPRFRAILPHRSRPH